MVIPDIKCVHHYYLIYLLKSDDMRMPQGSMVHDLSVHILVNLPKSEKVTQRETRSFSLLISLSYLMTSLYELHSEELVGPLVSDQLCLSEIPRPEILQKLVSLHTRSRERKDAPRSSIFFGSSPLFKRFRTVHWDSGSDQSQAKEQTDEGSDLFVG